MQRTIRINTKEQMQILALQAQTEAALQEIERMLNSTITNLRVSNPKHTIVRMDDQTNSLYVYNVTKKEWVEYAPVS